jgi:hypothetical protein
MKLCDAQTDVDLALCMHCMSTFLWYLGSEVFTCSELLACLRILVQHTAVSLKQKHCISERGSSHKKPGKKINKALWEEEQLLHVTKYND